MAGDPIISIDNCERPITGAFLCSMLTETEVQARILGLSERRLLPNNSLVIANGNNLAEFYNNFNADYTNFPSRTGADEADAIDAYTVKNSTKNGLRPTWMILNEISSGLWQLNPGAPSLNAERQWVIDAVTRLHDVYGYDVITYSPYETLGTTANAPSWQALAAKSYIAIESYQSGTEVWNSASANAASSRS